MNIELLHKSGNRFGCRFFGYGNQLLECSWKTDRRRFWGRNRAVQTNTRQHPHGNVLTSTDRVARGSSAGIVYIMVCIHTPCYCRPASTVGVYNIYNTRASLIYRILYYVVTVIVEVHLHKSNRFTFSGERTPST